MFILIDTAYFNVDHIACVRPVDDGDDQCVIFTTGQDATCGGFLINLSIEETFELIQNARLVELAQMLPEEDDENETASDPSPVDQQE